MQIGLDDKRQLVAIGTLTFVCTMAQHLTGDLLYEFMLGRFKETAAPYSRTVGRGYSSFAATERLVLAVISTIISVGVVRSCGEWESDLLAETACQLQKHDICARHSFAHPAD